MNSVEHLVQWLKHNKHSVHDSYEYPWIGKENIIKGPCQTAMVLSPLIVIDAFYLLRYNSYTINSPI